MCQERRVKKTHTHTRHNHTRRRKVKSRERQKYNEMWMLFFALWCCSVLLSFVVVAVAFFYFTQFVMLAYVLWLALPKCSKIASSMRRRIRIKVNSAGSVACACMLCLHCVLVDALCARVAGTFNENYLVVSLAGFWSFFFALYNGSCIYNSLVYLFFHAICKAIIVFYCKN